MRNSTLNFLINASAILSIAFNALSIVTSLNIYNIGYDPLALCIIGTVLLIVSWVIPTHDPLKVV